MNIREIKNNKTKHLYGENTNPLLKVLYNRGILSEEEFFAHDWDIVQTPYALDFIEAAADRLIQALENPEPRPIAVLVDCDCDGYTSASLLINYVDALYKMVALPNEPNLVPIHHTDKTHGLSDIEACKKIRALNPQLLIVPDASGTEEQYEDFRKIGIDIIVLDHHNTSERGDGEHIIVVNNQQSENYRNKSLSGVGVVYQFCNVLDDKYQLGLAMNWMPTIAVGLVADVMDLSDPETRFLVIEGFDDNYEKPAFIKQIMFADTNPYHFKNDKLNPHDIGWYIGPKFNAVTRISPESEKEALFKSMLDKYAYDEVPSGKRGDQNKPVPRVVEAIRLANNAHGRQNTRRKKLAEKIDNYLHESGALEHKILVVPIDDFNKDERALAGLAANELAEQYQRPVIVIFTEDKDYYSGSVRAPEGIEAYENFKDQCEESSFCIFVAGQWWPVDTFPMTIGVGLAS